MPRGAGGVHGRLQLGRGGRRRTHGRGVRLGRGNRPQALGVAEILLAEQDDVAVGDRWRFDRDALDGESEVGRPQELQQRAPREVSGDGREDDVEERGERFTGERQRVGSLPGDARIGKDLPGEIKVRQRPLKDDGPPVEGRRRSIES